MLDIMRENPWKAGIEQKERRLEEVKSTGSDEKSPFLHIQTSLLVLT